MRCRTQATNTSPSTNDADDLLTYKMASAAVTVAGNSKWRHCHCVYKSWLYCRLLVQLELVEKLVMA